MAAAVSCNCNIYALWSGATVLTSPLVGQEHKGTYLLANVTDILAGSAPITTDVLAS